MQYRVYPDGAISEAKEYDMPGERNPTAAVQTYAYDALAATGRDLVVVPVDAEAMALPGWERDKNGAFMLFRASPRVTWDVERVV